MTSLTNSLSNSDNQQALTQTEVLDRLPSLTVNRPVNKNKRLPSHRPAYVAPKTILLLIPDDVDITSKTIDNNVTVLNNKKTHIPVNNNGSEKKPTEKADNVIKKVGFKETVDVKYYEISQTHSETTNKAESNKTDQSKKTATWIKVAKVVFAFIFVTVLGTILAFSWKSIKYGCKELANSKVGDLFKKHFQETHEKVKSFFSNFKI